MNIFEQATKHHIRYSTIIGVLSVEDLWDLPLTGGKISLDDIAIELDERFSTSQRKSFVEEIVTTDKDAICAFDVVKRIIEVKLAERNKVKKAAETRENKQKIMAIIASKQDDELKDKSIEELSVLLNNL